MDFFNNVVIGIWSHDKEARSGFLSWGFHVCNLIEMIMDYFTKINERILLDLNAGVHIHLYARGMHNTKITYVVLSILADDHELRFPKLLVVRDLIVIGFTFTNFEDTSGAIDRDLQVLELLGIDSLEFHMQFVGSCTLGKRFKGGSLKIDWDTLDLLR